MLQCLFYSSFNMEPRLSILDSFENLDPYVHAKYKTISERYHGAEKYIFYYWMCVFISSHFTIVNQCELLSISKLYAYIFHIHLHFQMLYN